MRSFTELGFVTSDSDWAPERTGDYDKDCQIGRNYAAEFIKMMREQENTAFLGRIMRAMIAGGTYGGVEIGFCAVTAAQLL